MRAAEDEGGEGEGGTGGDCFLSAMAAIWRCEIRNAAKQRAQG
jgi:hypothetical protein